jgi:hypothetical protein
VCLRCLAVAQLDEVLTAEDGRIPEPFRELRDVFLAADHPRSVSGWLNTSPGVAVLRDLVNGRLPLTHDALDALPQRAAIIHLQQLLVACGALPQRDPNLARLERAVERLAGSLEDPADRKLIREFARWRILRRARRRAERDELGVTAAKNARTVVAEAVRFLQWLRERGLSLRDCRQADVDLWLATGVAARRRIGEFLRWAKERKALGQIEAPGSKTSSGAPRPIDAEARWAIARRLIHDDTLDTADRVVGTLVVLYGQPVTRIAKLRRSDVVVDDGGTFVRLGKELMPIAESLGHVVQALPTRRQLGPSGTVPAASEWLFPGRQAGLHIHPGYLQKRLGELGIECRASRNAALLQFGGQLPAAVIADKLNVHRTTADRWVKMAGGDWASYAARRAQA